MDKQHFDQLVKGVREMKRHMVGKYVRGVKATTVRPGREHHTRSSAERKIDL